MRFFEVTVTAGTVVAVVEAVIVGPGTEEMIGTIDALGRLIAIVVAARAADEEKDIRRRCARFS